MKHCLHICICTLALLAASACSRYQSTEDTVYQFSTIEALVEGLYDGDMTLAVASKHGDMGLGTFEGLNGEMVMIDGKCYRIDENGHAHEMTKSARMPYCIVTKFKSNASIGSGEVQSLEALQEIVDAKLNSPNYMTAIQVEGVFDYLKVRSVARQRLPYRRLPDVIENDQKVFEHYRVRGTLVGFRMPVYMAGVTVPGYHLHFISEDRRFGGHLLEMRGHDLKIDLDYSNQFHLVLPGSRAFQEVSLDGDLQKDLYKVEKGK
ncbi:MAG: acetolactate decarboxylase [Candidatus Sumerlaeota bacterium]